MFSEVETALAKQAMSIPSSATGRFMGRSAAYGGQSIVRKKFPKGQMATGGQEE
jgi:hypothetical protein